jgi:hypothetical protein
MSEPRVMLMVLSERTSSRGNTYLTGWLGKAKVIGFRGKGPDKFGNPTWEIFVAEPAQREQSPPPRQKPPTTIEGDYRTIPDDDQGPPMVTVHRLTQAALEALERGQ